jgi:CBS domain-containing protein
MRAQDVMTTEVATAQVDDPIVRAQETMAERRVHQLVVLDGKRVVGVISAHDAALRSGACVRDVMTAAPVVVEPRTTVREAANRLRGRGIGSLPVVEDDRVVGIITVTDLLELIGRGVTKPIERSTAWTLKGRGHRRKDPVQ